MEDRLSLWNPGNLSHLSKMAYIGVTMQDITCYHTDETDAESVNIHNEAIDKIIPINSIDRLQNSIVSW